MNRKHISTRDRARIFARHGGICHLCCLRIDGVREAWEVSHEIPLELGGADDDDNRKPAHASCHRRHTAGVDLPTIAKAKRREARYLGAKAPSRNSLPCGRNSPWRKRMDGSVIRRDP